MFVVACSAAAMMTQLRLRHRNFGVDQPLPGTLIVAHQPARVFDHERRLGLR